MTNLTELKEQYEERKIKRDECYNTYYRIPHDYQNIVYLKFDTSQLRKNPLENGRTENLIHFKGIVISREKKGTGRYESKFVEYQRYKEIALQPTCFDAIIDYADKIKFDVWSSVYIKVNLHFYSAKRKSWCKVYELQSITEEEFVKKFVKQFGNELVNGLVNEFGSITTTTTNKNKTKIKNEIETKEKIIDKEPDIVKEPVIEEEPDIEEEEMILPL